MEFINPPPFGVTRDLSNSPTYDEGTTVNIACTSGEKGVGVSLCLYQQNETDGKWFGDMEYLTRMQDTCSFLITRKNKLTFGTRERCGYYEILLARLNKKKFSHCPSCFTLVSSKKAKAPRIRTAITSTSRKRALGNPPPPPSYLRLFLLRRYHKLYQL